MMSRILEAITESLEKLKTPGGALCFCLPLGVARWTSIPVPKTKRGRELFRALLLEIGRMERDDRRFEVDTFTSVLDTESQRGEI